MTGYVHQLIDKKLDFRGWALTCMRNFGATVRYREEPLSKTVTEIKPDQHYFDSVVEAKKALADYEMLSLTEKIRKERTSLAALLRDAKKQARKENATNAKLQKMLDQVNAWQSPSPDHDGLKTFMAEQLTLSMEKPDYYNKEIVRLEAVRTYNELLQRAKATAETLRNHVQYAEERLAKEIARTAKSTEWIQTALNSLPKSTKRKAIKK